MPLVTVRELLDAGMHYGHHVSRWNPKMAPYIFGKRNYIHIINLRETMRGLLTAYKFIVHVVASGKMVVFVGTKRQARRTIRDQAIRCGMPYVVERWLGGTLTNFRTIRSRLERLVELENAVEGPSIEQLSKKEASRMRRELGKIRRNLEGIRNMDHLPGVVVVVDPRREKISIAEANRLNIPTIALADSDCDPDKVDVLIPGNDDAMRSIEVVMARLADAVLAGKEKRRALAQAEAEAAAQKKVAEEPAVAKAQTEPAEAAATAEPDKAAAEAKPEPKPEPRPATKPKAAAKSRALSKPKAPRRPRTAARRSAPRPKPEAKPGPKPAGGSTS